MKSIPNQHSDSDPTHKDQTPRDSSRTCNTRSEKPFSRRSVFVETLESRILFSGAPAAAPAAPPAADPAPAQEAPSSEETPPNQTVEQSADAPITTAAPNPLVETVIQPELNGAPVDAIPEVDQGVTAITLTNDEVSAIARAAAQHWVDSGLTSEQLIALSQISYQVSDLEGSGLGATEGYSIALDSDANGRGWFVDTTPLANEEFVQGEFFLTAADERAAGGIDLLSVLIHEQGHILGLDENSDSSDVMFNLFGTGERRLPVEGAASGATPGSLEGVHFVSADLISVASNQVDTNENTPVGLGISVDPAILLGGTLEDIIGVDTGFRASTVGTAATSFTIPANTTAVVITGYSNRPTDTGGVSDIYNDDYQLLSARIDLASGTSSGTLSHIANLANNGSRLADQYSWVDANLGVSVLGGTGTVDGDFAGGTDPTFTVSGSTLEIVENHTLQTSYHVEFLTNEGTSTNFNGTLSDVQQPGDTSSTFTIPTDTNFLVLTENSAAPGSDFNQESKNYSRIIVDLDTMTASGTVMAEIGETADRTVAYSFEGYSISASTPGGVLGSTATIVGDSAGLASVQHSPNIYINGSGELVVERTNAFADPAQGNFTTMYTVEAYERIAYSSISTRVGSGSDSSFFDATAGGGVVNTLTYNVPASAKVGIFRISLATIGGNETNENMGSGFAVVDLETGISNGSFMNIRTATPDLVSWQGVSLTDAPGGGDDRVFFDHSNSVSNRASLSEFTDGWGGTAYFDLTTNPDGTRTLTFNSISDVGNNAYQDYEAHGQFEWLGKEAFRLSVNTLNGTFSSGSPVLDATGNPTGEWEIDIADLSTLQFIPDPGASGEDVIEIKLISTTEEETITVSIHPIANTPDLTLTDSPAANEDTAADLSGSISSAVTDTDGSESVSLIEVSAIPDGFTLSDGGGNTFTAGSGVNLVDVTTWDLAGLTLTPTDDYNGTVTLNVRSQTTDTATIGGVPESDTTETTDTVPGETQATGSFDIVFTPQQDDPEAVGSVSTQNSDDADDITSFDVSGAFDDPDGDLLLFDDGGTLPTGLSIDPTTGIITGTIDSSASQGGPFTVTITADDGNGGTPAEQTFTWNVANPLPVALDDSFTAGEDDPSGVVGNAITNNDSDPDGDLLTATVLTGVAGSAGGTFAIATNGEVTFDPGTDFQDLGATESATTTFVYTLNDDDGGTDTATVTVTVDGANDDPNAVGTIADQNGTDSQPGVSLDVSGNFGDPDTSDTLTFTDGGTLPTGLSIDPTTGIITGTIDSSASQGGPFTVTITADDGNGGTPAEQTFTWNVANPLPVALDDSFTAGEDDPSGVVGNAITNNDSDPDGDLLTATVQTGVAGTSGGTFSIAANGEVTFDPGTDFQDLAGTESATTTFAYTLNDDDGGTDTATVTVTVDGANDDPNAVGTIADQNGTDSQPGVSLDVSGNFGDPDTSDTLTFTDGGTLPTGLSIDPTTGIITGTIDSSASQGGPFTVTITADDGNGGTPATQTFEWAVTNPLPVALDDSFTAGEDDPSGVVGNAITNNDSDPDGDLLTATPASGAGTGGGTFAIAANGEVTFDPGTDFQDLAGTESATTTFVYTLNDDDGGTDTATVTVTVDGANDDPNAVGTIADQSGTDSQPGVSLDVSGNFGDPDTSDTLTFTDGGTLPTGLSIDPTTGIITGTIDSSASQGGPFTVTITADDGNGGTPATQTFEWAVTNPLPVALNDSFTAGEDDPSGVVGNAITNNDSDPDGDLLTATVQTGVAGTGGGTFAIAANGEVTFDPGTDFQDLAGTESATTTFAYTLNDDDGGTDTATVTVTVDGANDDPNAVGTIADQSGTDSQPGVSLDVSGNFGDPDTSDTLTFTDGGTLPTGLSIDPTTGIITGTIDSSASQGGPFTVTITADDGNGGTPATQTFEWAVTNPLPVALDDSFTAGEDDPSGVVGNAITNNDSDPDGDLLTATPASGAGTGGGTFAIAANGEVTFDPGTDFQDLGATESATTTFVYTLNDADGGTDTATVTVTVGGANDAPTIDFDTNDDGGTTGADFAQTFTEGGLPVSIADTDTSLTDVDDTSMAALTLTISGIADGNEEVLSLAGTDFSLATSVTTPRNVTVGSTTFAITYDSVSGAFSFANNAGGEMPKADIQALIAATTYRNASPLPTEGDRIITASVNDGDLPSNVATSTVSVARDAEVANWLLSGSTSVAEGANAVYTIFHSDELRNRETASVQIDLTDIDTTATDHSTLDDAVTAAVASYNFGTKPGYLEWDGTTLTFTSDGTGIMTPFSVVLGTTDDPIYEGDEDFLLTLSNPGSTTGEIIGIATAPVTTTITDAADIPTLSIGNISAKEEVDTHAVFTVSLSNPSVEDVVFNLSLADGDATVGTDTGSTLEYFDGTDWLPVTGSVTISAGETALQVRTTIATDSLIENDETFTLTASPVSGTLASTADTSGTATILDIDARLTELLPPGSGVTTDVELVDDGTGRFDLVIEDVLTESSSGFGSKVEDADSFDRLSITRVGGNYIISDLGGLALGTPIIGASRSGASEIIVPVSMVSGDIIVRTGISDDVITVGDLGSLDGDLIIDGHNLADPHTDDFDIINYSSDFSGNGASFEAETINILAGSSLTTDTATGIDFEARRNIVIESGATVTATGGGNIDMEAHTSALLGGTPDFSAESFSAIEITAATVSVTGGGSITANGTSGSSGSYNFGVVLNPMSAMLTDGGSITVNGIANGGTGSTGVKIKSSGIQSSGGDILVTGQGGDTGTYDRGILVDVDFATGTRSVIDAGTGSVTIIGTGGGTGLYGTGVLIAGSDVTGVGVTISGTGSNTGTLFNEGVSIQKSTTVDAGVGDIDIDGTGGAGGTMNRGVNIAATALASDGGNLTIDGTGGGTALAMYGIGVQLTAVTATTEGAGTISMRGTGTDGRLYNEGVRIATSSQLTTVNGDITVDGTGGGTSRGSGVMVEAGSTLETSDFGAITLTGTGSTTGSYAYGVGVSASTVRTNGATLTVTGTGGQSGSSNRGVGFNNSDIENVGGGNIDLDGSGGGTGSGGIGVELVGSQLTASGLGSIFMDGTGAPAVSSNIGVKLATASSAQTEDGGITIRGTSSGTGLLNHGVQIASDSTLEATGFGAIDIAGTANSGSTLNLGVEIVISSITVNDGDLSLQGISNGTVSLNKGLHLYNATLSSSGDGNISVQGTGSDAGIGALNIGVDLTGGIISTADSGSINIFGTGGTGSVLNKGVKIANRSAVTTSGGAASISGTGGGSGALSGGVSVETYSTVSAGGWGDLNITGRGTTNGSSQNDGILVATGSEIKVGNGNMSILGTGGRGSLFNSGIQISGAKVLSTGGAISLTGGGGFSTSFNQGIRIISSTIEGAGNVGLYGSASDSTTGQNNSGVHIQNSTMNCGGLGEIFGTGGGGTGSNHGIFMNGILGDFSGTMEGETTDGNDSSEDESGVIFGILPAAILGTKQGRSRRNRLQTTRGAAPHSRFADATKHTLESLFERIHNLGLDLLPLERAVTRVFRHQDNLITLDPLFAQSEIIDATLATFGLQIDKETDDSFRALLVSGDDDELLSGLVVFTDANGGLTRFSSLISTTDEPGLTVGAFLDSVQSLESSQPSWSESSESVKDSPLHDTSSAFRSAFGIR